MNAEEKILIEKEFAGVDAALKRAAKSALKLAKQTKTPCYVWKNGQIVDIAQSRKR